MQVCEQNRREKRRKQSCAGESHDATAAAVDQNMLARRLHEC